MRTADPTLPNAYIETDRNDVAPMSLDVDFVEDPFEEVTVSLNEEQKHALLV